MGREFWFDVFPAVDLDNDDEVRKFYNSFCVSCFDHWLSESEAASCDFICRETARSRGGMDAFLLATRKLSSFFESIYLSNDVFAFDEQESPLGQKRYSQLIDSLVSEKKQKSLFYKRYGLFLLPGYDLTHVLLFVKGFDQEEIIRMIQKAGLHTLKINYAS